MTFRFRAFALADRVKEIQNLATTKHKTRAIEVGQSFTDVRAPCGNQPARGTERGRVCISDWTKRSTIESVVPR